MPVIASLQTNGSVPAQEVNKSRPPVSGPKGKRTLYVAALKEAGIWKLTFLQFGADDSAARMQLS
jgi:hypothetical protein